MSEEQKSVNKKSSGETEEYLPSSTTTYVKDNHTASAAIPITKVNSSGLCAEWLNKSDDDLHLPLKKKKKKKKGSGETEECLPSSTTTYAEDNHTASAAIPISKVNGSGLCAEWLNKSDDDLHLPLKKKKKKKGSGETEECLPSSTTTYAKDNHTASTAIPITKVNSSGLCAEWLNKTDGDLLRDGEEKTLKNKDNEKPSTTKNINVLSERAQKRQAKRAIITAPKIKNEIVKGPLPAYTTGSVKDNLDVKRKKKKGKEKITTENVPALKTGDFREKCGLFLENGKKEEHKEAKKYVALSTATDISDHSGSDTEWYNKNDDDLLKDVLRTLKKKDNERNEEYLPPIVRDEYIVAADPDGGPSKVNTYVLREMSTMIGIDMFLYARTNDTVPNFYKDQISSNDTQERVLLYTHILAAICQMELPGFQEELLESFSSNTILMEHFRLLTRKLFRKGYKELWSSHSKQMKEFLENVQTLLMQTFKIGLLNAEGVNLVKGLCKIAKKCDNRSITCMQISVDFKKNLRYILNENEAVIWNQSKREFYPTLEELLEPYTPKEPYSEEFTKFKDVRDYIKKHMRWLREMFKDPLHSFIYEMRTDASNLKKKKCPYLYKDVSIILNEKYFEAHHSEFLFVDVLGSERPCNVKTIQVPRSLYEKLSHIKIGSLLCFSTNTEFDNLILATVIYTNEECLWNGYLAIEIVKQYNIGNIYQKKLLMFETPIFYEAYKNAYNFLKTSDDRNFPFQKYIVFGETESHPPAYLDTKKIYDCDGIGLEPLAKQVPEKLFNLNASQRKAFMTAMGRELTLIQGPPGTGKTHLAIHLVKTLIKTTHTPIVLLNFTNQTLDNFIMKLSEHTDSIVRFGGNSRSPEVEHLLARNIDYEKNSLLNKLWYIIKEEFRSKFQMVIIKQSEFDGRDDNYEDIKNACNQLTKTHEKMRTLRTLFQYYLAREKLVIAMTTTFAAKNNFLFRLLRSSIVIFEEAAEILESHVVSSLTPYTQHVIMIGDHQQLRPYCDQYPLCLSLFERLFILQKQPLVLTTQYRMRVDIANLLTPTIYKNLDNDGSVFLYPSVRGMAQNVYFMSHTHGELRSQKEETSISNAFEIDEIIKLAQYLIKVGEYSAQNLVILSPYSEQIKRIRYRLLQDEDLMSVKACTIDAYQGLEADIVLLSLVRNTRKKDIGFLEEPHRICVALSRARYGLYMIGNLCLFSKRSSYWLQVQRYLLMQNAVGDKFPFKDNSVVTSLK
uniref:AAA domain-containing protein n=1 Tax=Glossina austeni TaxID=7395 RepID=A0A1A9VAG4_GLOAU